MKGCFEVLEYLVEGKPSKNVFKHREVVIDE